MPSANRIAVIAGLVALTACGGTPPATTPAPRAALPGSPVSDTPVKIGPPYTIGGVTYTPEDVADYDAVGYASWYGGDLAGQTTANGETLNPAAISAAHRTLPLPSYVEVTALDTGRTIVVRINDRGPFTGNRIIDLSAGAAEQLGIAGSGAVPVRVRRVNPTDGDKALLRSGARAPERIPTPEDLLVVLRKQIPGNPPMAALPPPPPPPPPAPAATRPTTAKPPSARPPAPVKAPAPAKPPVEVKGGFIVQIATFSSRFRAETAARKLGAKISPAGNLYRVRLGPFPSEAAASAAVKQAAGKGYPGGRIMANENP